MKLLHNANVEPLESRTQCIIIWVARSRALNFQFLPKRSALSSLRSSTNDGAYRQGQSQTSEKWATSPSSRAPLTNIILRFTSECVCSGALQYARVLGSNKRRASNQPMSGCGRDVVSVHADRSECSLHVC